MIARSTGSTAAKTTTLGLGARPNQRRKIQRVRKMQQSLPPPQANDARAAPAHGHELWLMPPHCACRNLGDVTPSEGH